MAAKQEPANYGSGGSTTSSEVEGGVVLGLDGARQGKHADAGKPTREGFYLTIGTVIDFRLWPLPIDLLMLFYMLSVYMQGAAGNELVRRRTAFRELFRHRNPSPPDMGCPLARDAP